MPSEIGLLTSLERLVISNMKVSGPILNYLSQSANLTILDVRSNSFTGTIPDAFGKDHPSLVNLNLELNQFSGKIPESIGTFTSLTTLNLQHNQISGSIPSEIASIPTLRTYFSKDFYRRQLLSAPALL
jgi:Leucine-rich repeat (LRR) protein